MNDSEQDIIDLQELEAADRLKPAITREDIEYWRENPIEFFIEALDVQPEHVWDKMEEVVYSVRDNERTAVPAGHGLSKTYTAGRLPLWFLITHWPATVITTAPTHKQVEELLWRELKAAYGASKFKIGGKLTKTKLDFQEETGDKAFAIGFATKPETITGDVTTMLGYHNENVMVIFDEASGIHPLIWKSARYLLTAGFWRWLVIGNPVAPTGDFVDAMEKGSDWNVINIAVTDTPNYKAGHEIIPGVSGREFEEEMAQKHGKDSNEYKVRVLGIKPDYSEQTYLGREMAAAKANDQIGFYPPEPMAMVYTVWDLGNMHNVIIFTQFIRNTIRIIDFYYDSKGLGIPYYATILQDKARERRYKYAQHFAPWDFGGERNDEIRGPNAKSVQTGKYLTDIARELDMPFHILKQYGRDNQIAAAADIIRLCQFNRDTTEELVKGLFGYRRKRNEALSTADKPVYHKDAVKDWTEHVGSAWCGLACLFRYELEIHGVPIGWPQAQPEHDYMEPDDTKFDPLRHGLVHSK